MAEQFRSMEHDAFRVPYLSDKTLEAAFNGQAVDRSRRSTTLRIERPSSRCAGGLTELMSVLQRGRPPGRQGTSRGSVGRWAFAEVDATLISERTPEGALGPPERGSLGVFTAGPAS